MWQSLQIFLTPLYWKSNWTLVEKTWISLYKLVIIFRDMHGRNQQHDSPEISFSPVIIGRGTDAANYNNWKRVFPTDPTVTTKSAKLQTRAILI